MAKLLRYVRHSNKCQRGGYSIIHKAGLDRVQKEVLGIVPVGLTDIFHSFEIRTAQTALAIAPALAVNIRIHEPIMEVGTDELFDQMYTEEVEQLCAEDEDLWDIEAFLKVHGPEEVEGWMEMAARGVKKMLSLIEDGGTGLCCGHEPMISLAARAFGQEEVENLETLETLDFIDFVRKDNGKISIES